MKLGSNRIRYVYLLVALCLAVPLAAAVLLRTDAVQRGIGEALSSVTGMQVKCESFQPGFWSATRMTRLTASNQEGSALSANEVFVKVELLPLLAGQLVFREIRLEGVRLVRIEGHKAVATNTAASIVVNSGPEGDASGGSAKASQDKEGQRLKLLRALRVLSVSEAAVDWQLADGRTKLQLEGVDLRLRLNDEGAGAGEFTASRGKWMDVMQARDLRAVLRFEGNALRVDDIRATCGEGPVAGSGEVNLLSPQPFAFKVNAKDVDLEKMSSELPSLRLSGKAQAGLQIQGSLADDGSWTGTGNLEIVQGKLKGVNLLQMIGQIFQIQEIANFQIKKGLVNLRIADRKIFLDEFLLDGGDLLLAAPGTLDFQRNVALDAKLSVPERLLNGRVAQLLSKGFGAPDEAGLRSIAFQVGGTLEKPSTNLMEKAVGEGLGGVVNQLLGGFLKTRKVEKQEPKEAPAEAPR